MQSSSEGTSDPSRDAYILSDADHLNSTLITCCDSRGMTVALKRI
jgi:hypothetical protein